MKQTLKYVILSVVGLILAACIIISFTAGANARKTIACEAINVVIKDSTENGFVSKADILSYIDREYGRYIGIPVDSIDLCRIEKIVNGRSAVKKSQAYVTKDGTLHIEVTQRKPVVRFQKKNGGFYADSEGFIFPLQRTYSSHVQIIDGNIPLAANSGYKGAIEDPEEMEWFRRMMNVVNYIEDSRTWRHKIVQIHVLENGELLLIPRKGNENFLFGHPDNIEDKFKKMGKYYTHIIPEKGEGHYKTVDLKYEGQIVCRK